MADGMAQGADANRLDEESVVAGGSGGSSAPTSLSFAAFAAAAPRLRVATWHSSPGVFIICCGRPEIARCNVACVSSGIYNYFHFHVMHVVQYLGGWWKHRHHL